MIGTAGGRAAQTRARRASAGSVKKPGSAERLPRAGGRPLVSASGEQKQTGIAILFYLSGGALAGANFMT